MTLFQVLLQIVFPFETTPTFHAFKRFFNKMAQHMSTEITRVLHCDTANGASAPVLSMSFKNVMFEDLSGVENQITL
jgi:hypothetical protein